MSSLQTQPVVRRIMTSLTQSADAAKTSGLVPPEQSHYRHLFAVDPARGEGHYVVLSKDGKAGVLTREVFKAITQECQAAKLGGRWNIHAAFATYSGPGIVFFKWAGREFERIVFK